MDDEVKAIFASIGGDDSIRILSNLEPEIIRKSPKIMMGFSDTTTLLTYMNQLGMVTFYGPSIMAGFSQWNSLGSDFHGHIEHLLFSNPSNFEYYAYDSYTEGYLDWSDESNVGKIEALKKNTGWNWLQGSGKVQGKLFGGCIEALEFMKGTRFWPHSDFWNEKILFLETSEEKPPPEQVKWMLRNYGIQGIFDKISAILIGRPKDYSDEEKKELDDYVLKVVQQEFGNKNIPIISNMDFGHTDPQWILPLGINAEIDCQSKKFRLIEQIFED
jgi:muramoyltetrapeptide carboxypeptidase LdcA involved in peptidoglycan recycling